jgi:hypothetical protein
VFTESWIEVPDVSRPWFRCDLIHVGVQLLSQFGVGVVCLYRPVSRGSQVVDCDGACVPPGSDVGCGEGVEHGRVVEEPLSFKDGLCALKEWHVCGVQVVGPWVGEDWCGVHCVNHTHSCSVESAVFDSVFVSHGRSAVAGQHPSCEEARVEGERWKNVEIQIVYPVPTDDDDLSDDPVFDELVDKMFDLFQMLIDRNQHAVP